MGLAYYKWYQSQTLGGIPTRTLGLKGGVDCEIPHRLERETSVNEDARPRKGVVDCEISYQLERGTKHSL